MLAVWTERKGRKCYGDLDLVWICKVYTQVMSLNDRKKGGVDSDGELERDSWGAFGREEKEFRFDHVKFKLAGRQPGSEVRQMGQNTRLD